MKRSMSTQADHNENEKYSYLVSSLLASVVILDDIARLFVRGLDSVAGASSSLQYDVSIQDHKSI